MFSILILTAHNVSGKLKNRGNSSETISYLSFLFIAGRSIFPAHNQGVWIHTLSNDRDDYKGGKGPNICLTNITLGRKFKLTFPSCITFIVVLSCHLHLCHKIALKCLIARNKGITCLSVESSSYEQ